MSDVDHRSSQPATDVGETLRDAALQHRRVRAMCRADNLEGGPDYERFWEPYSVTDGEALVYSYLRNEFRHVPLHTIVSVELCPETFAPRRSVDRSAEHSSDK